MSDRMIVIRQPAIQGWTSGVPRYEANSLLYQREKTGSSGAPGVFDELSQQWYRVAANLAKGRAFVEQLQVATVPCGYSETQIDGDETPDEARWNDALESMLLGGRVAIEGADDYSFGIGALLSQVHDVCWYGFGVWEPYWLRTGAPDGAGVDLSGAVLALAPLARSACYQWLADRQTHRLQALRYLGSGSAADIDAEELIHISHGGGPGEYFGRAELRPLVGLFHAWRESLVSNASANRAARGRLVVTEPELLDAAGRARIDGLVQAFDDGRVDSFTMPHGASASIAYPGGTMPDYSKLRSELDQAVDYVFDSRNSALGIFGSGSRAVADTLGAEDGEARHTRWSRDVNRAWQRVAAWVASQTGYTGRIRTAEPVGAESADTGDVLDFVTRGLQSQALSWTAADEAWLRERGGLLSSEAAGIGAEPTEDRTALLVGQLQASQSILQSLTSTDPAAPRIAPEAAVELLIAAGNDRDNAERMVRAQVGQTAAQAEPEAGTAEEAESGRALEAAQQSAAFQLQPFSEHAGCGCGGCASLNDAPDLTPTREMAEAAQRALDVREGKPASQRGMTDVGLARARDLINRRTLSPDTVRRMHAYFSRHEVDKQGSTWDQQGKGWQAWHGWGGDAGQRWAQRKVAQLERAALSDGAESYSITGADGLAVSHYRPALTIELDGETIQPEALVAWQTDSEARRLLDAELAASLDPIVQAHRAAVWDALREGYDPSVQARIFDDYKAQYSAAITAYVERVKAEVADQRAQERDRQEGRRTTREGLALESLRAWAQRTLGRAVAQVDIAADTIASRVQAPVERSWSLGGNLARDTFDPGQTLRGLAREARGPADQVESVGALVEGAEGADPGRVIIAATRSSMRDGNVCAVCVEEDGRTFRFPEDQAAFDAYLEQHPLPDPECTGSKYGNTCRCRWVLVWGTQD